MGVIKNWNTVYPVAIDDLVTNFPVLVDATDEVIASHSNELAKAVVALETEQQAIVTTVSGLGNVQALYNSVSQTTTLRSINFTGSGVAVTTVGNDITVTVSTSTTDRYSDTIIVGNSAAGDTTATCHYLETGTGAALVSALTAAGALSPPGNVFIRRGTYTTTAQTTMINVPAGVHVSGAGVGATVITGRSAGDIGIFSVKAGASLSNLSVTAPTPSAGATCPNYLVELLNNTTLKNVVINVAAGTNSPLTFVTGYYAAGIPDGITIEDVRINITGSSIPAAYIDPIDIGDSSGATYTNPTKPVSIKNVVVDVSGANKASVAAAMSLYSLGVSVDSCKAVGCSLLSFSPSGTLNTATVAGPSIRNSISDMTGRPAGTHYGVSLQPTCYNGTVIGTVIDGITVLGSTSSAAGSKAVLFNVVPTTSPVTFKGNTISNVSSYFSTAGAGGIDIEAQAGATISSTKVSNCAVTGDSLISCAATGYVSDTDIINNAGRNFSITGTSANVTGLSLVTPRFTGTVTTNEATRRVVGKYTVATTANLPNVSGSPTQTSYLSVGDEAYVTGSASTYVCTNATVGSAVWSGGVTTGAPIYGTNIFFSPSNPSPAQGVITTWDGLQAALTAAGQWVQKRVHVDGQYVSYTITVPSGITHVWDMTEFLGDDSTLSFAQGCSISSFWGVGFTRLFLTCQATSGSSPFTSYVSGYASLPVFLREGSSINTSGGGILPLFFAGASVDSFIFTLFDGTYILEGGSVCIRLTGGSAIFECMGDASISSSAIASANAGSAVTIYAGIGYGTRIGSSAFTSTFHPAWTLGTVTFNKRTSASMLTVTPTGNITSTEAQSALAELDTKKAAISGGQLGGTAASPDVRGIRETSGPTLLTFGSITDGQTLVRSGSTVVGAPSAVPTSFYFIPGSVSPPSGAYTSWSALMAAIGTLRLVLPTAKVTVTVDGSAVGGVVDVPSGTYDWTNIEFVGAAFETLNFKAGASVTQFNQVTFRYLQLQTDATAGSPAFVTSAVYTWSIYFYAAAAFDLGAGYIPLFRSASSTGGLLLHFYDGGCLYQSGGTASAVADATGGTIYVNIFDSGYVESRTIASTNPASAAWFSLLSPAAMDPGSSNWLDSHPLWTSGTITTTISSAAKYVRSATSGVLTATDVQAALVQIAARLAKTTSAGSYVATIQTVSTATATVGADVDLVLVTYTGGTCALTFPTSTTFPVGRSCIVQKANTSSNGITVQGGGSDQVNDGTAGAAMLLPNSATPSSTTTTDQAYLVQRVGSTSIRVS